MMYISDRIGNISGSAISDIKNTTMSRISMGELITLINIFLLVDKFIVFSFIFDYSFVRFLVLPHMVHLLVVNLIGYVYDD